MYRTSTNYVQEMTPESAGTAPVNTNNGYRTRSGRVVRNIDRYAPDEDTIFDDEESPDSDYTDMDIEGESENDESENGWHVRRKGSKKTIPK